MKRHLMIMTNCIILVVLLISGCSNESTGNEKSNGSITVLSAPGEGIMSEVITAFEEETGINVNYSEMGIQPLHSKLATIFGSKSSEVDVVWTYSAWTSEFGNAGFLEPIDDDISKELKDDLIPGSLEAVTYKGVLYGIPRFLSMRMFYYNKEAFEEAELDPNSPPKTWAEFKDMAVKLTKDTDGDGKIDQYGYLGDYGAPNNNVMQFELLLYLNGGQMFDEYDEIMFNNDKGREALEELVELHELGVVDPASMGIASGGDKSARFATGNAATMFGWFSTYAYANDPEKSQIVDKLGWGIIPALGEETASVGGSEGYAISKFSENKDDSLKFLEFIASKEAQKGIAMRTGWMPVLQSVFNDLELNEKLPYTETVKEQSQFPAYRFAAPYAQEVIDILGPEILNAVNGNIDAQTALNNAAEKVKPIVDQYK